MKMNNWNILFYILIYLWWYIEMSDECLNGSLNSMSNLKIDSCGGGMIIKYQLHDEWLVIL